MFLDSKKKVAISIFAAAFFVSLDRLLKMIALRIYPDQDLPLIGEILRFNFVKNYNIAFSLPVSGMPLLILNILLIIGLLFVCLSLYREKRFFGLYALAFVVLGAMSNLFDRIKFGFVVDYIDLKYFTVFNIADMMIVGGAVLLLSQKIKHISNYERKD